MAMVNTLYGDILDKHIAIFAKVELLVCDVDGVFSDGNIYLGNNGEELKAFNTKDGYGIKALAQCGVDVAVITGRSSEIVAQRMRSLQVKHIIQGREDKAEALLSLQKEHAYHAKSTVSIGDDMPDLGMFAHSKLGVCVADGHPYVQQQAGLVLTKGGGKGAVRELCDLILLAKGRLNQQFGSSI